MATGFSALVFISPPESRGRCSCRQEPTYLQLYIWSLINYFFHRLKLLLLEEES
ncbi:hypothetical protein M6B38_160630 [Iris pallida]|uniref:Uncharacterized protein n=1 Tax=Iris pallida TaxID=29817 RepID=A0AAX6EZF2_IRIPA|nr:hypothetical protein M6B38_160630 [Iris pallida]